MAEAFETPLDVARRACQHLGERMIDSFHDTDDVAAKEFNESYPRLRDFELERSIWSFSIRDAILRPVDSNSELWTPATYNNATTYAAGSVVGYVPVDATDVKFPTVSRTRPLLWQATDSVTGEKPDASFKWSRYSGPVIAQVYQSGVSYGTGELVDSSGTIYMSLTVGNTDTPPSSNWMAIGGTAAALSIFYPIGTGPVNDGRTRNVMRLPHSYLRQAPWFLFDNDYPYLGADISPCSDDMAVQGEYFITTQAVPQVVRFASSVVDVFLMHAMFCEMLAARMAYEGCERITGSADKRKEALTAYEFFGNQARLVNAILDAQPRQPQSEYITVRV